MVEFALVAPALFALFLGIFEFGRLMAVWISLQQGAQEAARYGAVSSHSTTSVVQRAKEQTALIGPGLSDCTTTPPPGGGSTFNAITSSACTGLAGGGVV